MYNHQEHKTIYDTIQCTLNKYHSNPTLMLSPDHYFFIKCIEFYESAEDAAKSRGGILIDLSSRETAERSLCLDPDNADGLFGKHEFDNVEHALSLKRSNSPAKWADYGSRVKFSLRMRDSSVLDSNHSFMVVTYKTNLADSYSKLRLLLGNYWGNYTILAPDVSVSNGSYVKTAPIDIRVFDNPKQDFFERLLRPRYHSYNSTDADLLCVAPYDESGIQLHQYFEILYVIDGEINASVHTLQYQRVKGDMIIVPPLCAHNVASNTADSSLYSIRFTPEHLCSSGISPVTMRHYISMWENHLRYSPFIDAKELCDKGLDKLIVDIISMLQTPVFANQVKIHAKLMTIFSVLLDRCAASNPPLITTGASPFEAAINEARKNPYTFTTADAAKVSNMSYNYFCANFKKAHGISFSAYLDSLRLRESERLLLATEMSITDIAMAMGFSDASHYIRKFKLAYNITPRQFRNSMRNGG